MPEQQTGRVSVETVTVGSGGARDLQADLFRPPAGTANGAGVLLVHGGGWVQGDRSQLRGYGILLGRLGFTSLACEYRLAPGSRWPAQIHDVKAALRWFREHARALGFDPAKLVISGNSAGGHLSLMVAGTQNILEFEGEGGNAGVPTDVAACIAFYAPAVLGRAGTALSEPVRALLGEDAPESALDAASPVSYVAASFPPTLLITGNNDALVPSQSSFQMYRALVDAGAQAELHVYGGAPHGFDAIPDLGRQCASIMALFVDRYIVNPRDLGVPQNGSEAARGAPSAATR